MALADLTETELEIVYECLMAAAHGPFIPDWEFSTLFGVEQQEVAKIAERWPDVDDNDEAVRLSINNSLNNLTGYPIDREDAWNIYISVGPEELVRILKKFRKGIWDE